MQLITWPDFEKIEIRVGTIVEVENFPEAKIPAYKIKVDFGSEIGIKKSSARITEGLRNNERWTKPRKFFVQPIS